MEKLGCRNVLKDLKQECLTSINRTCDDFDTKLVQALAKDDFDAVADVLTSCGDICSHLDEYVLKENKNKLTLGAIESVRAHTTSNHVKALGLIRGSKFDACLASLLDAIRDSSKNETMLRHVSVQLEGEYPAGENDYKEVTSELNRCSMALAKELQGKFRTRCHIKLRRRVRFDGDHPCTN